MTITKDTTFSELLKIDSKCRMLVRAMGICCINDENENWSLEKLCEETGTELDKLLEALVQLGLSKAE